MSCTPFAISVTTMKERREQPQVEVLGTISRTAPAWIALRGRCFALPDPKAPLRSMILPTQPCVRTLLLPLPSIPSLLYRKLPCLCPRAQTVIFLDFVKSDCSLPESSDGISVRRKEATPFQYPFAGSPVSPKVAQPAANSWAQIALDKGNLPLVNDNGLCSSLKFYPPQAFDGDIVSISPPRRCNPGEL
ncbi:hypothetical protein Nepgr_031671 [Nepenthes gracilis]|uniref:Uncharacterized protein n=1 Tax=Nepenthes gracilis TaxID=150966 RepID=A0AAD3TIX5_NEPGR|nr:hypothetical protein Nepgr_031671 [Nepenthes gracilis]